MTTQQTHWTITLEEDPETGDLILPFPVDMLAQVGWDCGDIIVWTEHNDGSSYILTKKETPTVSDRGPEEND